LRELSFCSTYSRAFPYPADGWKSDGGQYADDSDDGEQFQERES
jgi:hypothetical protein